VQAQVSSRIQEMRDREQALDSTVETLNQRIKDLSTVARQYSDIQRELDIATANLNQFLNKREVLRIDEAQRQTPWDILTPPGTPISSSRNPYLNLAAGTVLGFLLGSGAAFAVDKLIDKVRTVQDLKEFVPIPLLGTIPYNVMIENGRPASPLMDYIAQPQLDLTSSYRAGGSQESQYFTPFLEAFRVLDSNIRSRAEGGLRSLTVSSAIAGEGKSSVSFYLAYASASMGKRTLLVDTDFRHPTLQKLCGVSNTAGLSNYALGELSFEDTILPLRLDENLFLVPSGPQPLDPAKLLSSARMAAFLKRAAKDFDMVIFDTPPLLGFADAFLLAKKTQGLLLVSRVDEIKFGELETVIDELAISRVPVIGMVANGSKQESQKLYSFYQGYGQTYDDDNNDLDGGLGEENGFVNGTENLNPEIEDNILLR
jgi:polysaccharide biosynthesis transport protein